jgi:hypothetical protein
VCAKYVHSKYITLLPFVLCKRTGALRGLETAVVVKPRHGTDEGWTPGTHKAPSTSTSRLEPVKGLGNSCCTARGCGWTRLSRHSALSQIGRSAHWRPRMAKSGRAGLAPQCPSTQAHGPALVLQVKSFGVHTSHPRRVGAEHFQRHASTRQPAEIADNYHSIRISAKSPWGRLCSTRKETL